ncbi:phytanoyl-CoA dioxygenase family protein [Asanoa iriomotensis]|uniref:L-proline 4-hydroxylase n=1 Tax=Asanoa iriomotensis TaxID=234613 RepID=A0ABQ4BZ46_9ACTN|nr:phytanoyl-CoA dioxygenase family protein [Asanoa iriomotensis]GIF55770.1 L-proline 4-hydroxylase [Asanoa iriomotensis]
MVEVTLTQAQVDRFHERGFLRLAAITSQEEVTRLQGVYDGLFEPGALVSERDRYELAGSPDAPPALPQIVNPERYAPQLLETIAYRNATRVAAQLLGDDVKPGGMHAIRKPAKDGAATPWHQDEAYWDPAYEHRGISIWIPLQPATLENGCMQFVPGSHHLGVQPHQLINADSHGLELASLELVEEAVACPLPPGGATIHFSRTVHYAGPNTSTEPRRALIMGFSTPPTLLPQPRHMPWQRPEWYA